MPSPQRTERQSESSTVAARITIGGPVQGFGIRPTISRLADSVGVAGLVYNAATGVVVEVEGPRDDVEAFGRRLETEMSRFGMVGDDSTGCPSGKMIEIVWQAIYPPGRTRFRIGPSQTGGDFATMVPSDRAVCQYCLDEVANRDDRRFGYPFTTCTRCGPRYSIIASMPYDRERTAMVRFVMCEDCRREYESPSDRRFHAQTNGCPRCGPRVWVCDAAGEVIGRGNRAIILAVEALRVGRVVGLRGVGGYQWLVGAADRDAVDALRRAKRRPDKPLAVMVADMIEAERLAAVTDLERTALSSPANPIVVLARRGGEDIAPCVHGDLDTIGVMLPSTPLHELVSRRFGGPLVVTSGNFEGEPIAFE
jgi:hydrogenase maturation protein HypF